MIRWRRGVPVAGFIGSRVRERRWCLLSRLYSGRPRPDTFIIDYKFRQRPIERVRAFVIGNNSRVRTAARNEPVDSPRSSGTIPTYVTGYKPRLRYRLKGNASSFLLSLSLLFSFLFRRLYKLRCLYRALCCMYPRCKAES